MSAERQAYEARLRRPFGTPSRPSSGLINVDRTRAKYWVGVPVFIFERRHNGSFDPVVNYVETEIVDF